MSSVNLARDFLPQDMDGNLHVYLHAIFTAAPNGTAGFPSATYSVMKTNSRYQDT